jgi:trans-aconitate methyltransferase
LGRERSGRVLNLLPGAVKARSPLACIWDSRIRASQEVLESCRCPTIESNSTSKCHPIAPMTFSTLAEEPLLAGPELGSVLVRSCWFCEQNQLVVLPHAFERVVTAVCNHCGLIQRRTINEAEEIQPECTTFYEDSRERAMQWLRMRALFDTCRLSRYVDLVLKHCDLGSIHKALDVGCAEGLFSHLLKARSSSLEAFGVEPDPFCIEYGKSQFPEVSLEEIRIEGFRTNQQFDLVTDFGAIYRCVRPMEMLERYRSLMTPDGVLAIGLGCSTGALGDANLAIAPDSASGLWPVTSNHGFVRMIADPSIFKQMLLTYFEEVDVEWMKQLPYRKTSPFFFARKPRSTPLPAPAPSPVQVEVSLSFLYDYAINESCRAIDEFIEENKPRRVAIYGATDEGGILEQFLVEKGVQVAYRIHPFAHLVADQAPLAPARFLDALEEDPVDLIIIADLSAQETHLETLRYLGLLHEHRFFLAFDKRQDDPSLFGHIAGERVLNKAFRFVPVPSQ